MTTIAKNALILRLHAFIVKTITHIYSIHSVLMFVIQTISPIKKTDNVINAIVIVKNALIFQRIAQSVRSIHTFTNQNVSKNVAFRISLRTKIITNAINVMIIV